MVIRFPHKYATLFIFIGVWFSDFVVRINSFIGLSNGTTILVFLLQLITIVVMMFYFIRTFNKQLLPPIALMFISLFITWTLFQFVRGTFVVQGYWEWKSLLLSFIPMFFVPFFMLFGLRFELTAKFLRVYLVRIIPISLLLIPYSLTYDLEAFSRLVLLIAVFVTLIPFLDNRWKLLIFVIFMLSLAMDLSYRSNVMRILASVSALLAYYLIKKNNYYVLPMNIFSIAIFFLPLLFLWLGHSGQFNVFTDIKLDIELSNSFKSEENLSATNGLDADTRTFLYKEVTESMNKRDTSYWIGGGAGTGYESEYFQASTLSYQGRTFSESGFLNILLHYGIIGVFLYAATLFSAIYYGINRSRNTLTKMLALILGFHWVLFFIEDIYKFDSNYFSIWLMIGMCLSNNFRKLSDADIKLFLKNALHSKPLKTIWN